MADFKIQVRRDTAANWQSINPVLGLGEPGWDLTNLNLKIGDGTTPWNSLAVASYAEIAAFNVTPSSPMPVNAYGELMETLQAIRMGISYLTRGAAGAMTDVNGRNRTVIESFTATPNIGSQSGTIGTFNSNDFMKLLYHVSTDQIRRNITIT